MLKKSFVLSPALPASETDMGAFERQAAKYAEMGAEVIEFYCAPELIGERARALSSLGLEAVYLPATFQKRNRSSLCALDEQERKEAVRRAVLLGRAAAEAGIGKALYTSGWYPEEKADAAAAYEAEARSLRELSEELPDSVILIEPGDREVQYRQLLGPTDELTAFLAGLGCGNVRLTMDTSHILQLGEDVMTSLAAAKRYCSHVHFANCILTEGDRLYGDKHPLFGCRNGELSIPDAERLLREVTALWGEEELTVSVEFINHEGSERFMTEIDRNTEWFWRE